MALAWYTWLSVLSQGLVVTLDGWIEAINLPMVSAALFGLVGATSPCQLTTTLGALAYVARESPRGGAFTSALAYAAGKVAVYGAAGALVVLAGLQLQAASIPVVVAARKVLGPLMLLVGLGMLGAVRLPGGAGQRSASALQQALPMRGAPGAFLLGVTFSFAFCPTLFWLFFGLTVPLALRSAGGWSFPGLFALGSTLPLLVLSGVVALGFGALEATIGKLSRVQRIASAVAGAVFILAGLHDTVVYWWL
ncbi:MAG: hypothetical protein A3I03_16430 [Candidatus Rokubacteria bacterium RIFCSPLOWO2_02_FULL_68_19]|nr:MAG: hypothetical protein A3I03_16430 [Candidatus Rokubacteria bacterium RIFCSPLOWO2_02_FULL_68_19]